MLELRIQGMNCGHCVKAVTRAVQTLDPAAKVEVDLAAGLARVQTTKSADAVAACIREQGYGVSPA